MKIAIAHFNRLKNDGFALYIEELKKALKEHEVDVLISNNTEWETDKTIIGLRKFIPYKLGLIDDYYAKKIDENYDYLWLNWLIWSAFGPIALKLKKCKLIFDYHGLTPQKFLKNWLYRLLIKKASDLNKELASKASLIITHSRFTMKELGVSKARVLPLPVYTRRKGRGKKSDYLLYVGRITPNKRIDIIIKALKGLNKELLIIGNYKRSKEYRNEKRKLDKLIKELRVKVKFLGQVSDGELNNYYKQAFAFVTASEHEGFCAPVIEAMSQGTPVIGARAAALIETISSDGLLFKPGDYRDLARKVRMLENKRLYNSLVKRGLRKAKNHSASNFRKKILSFLNF